MFIVPWVSYLIAEALEFSGIVSIIFCGISMARYAIPNLSKSGRKVKLIHNYNRALVKYIIACHLLLKI